MKLPTLVRGCPSQNAGSITATTPAFRASTARYSRGSSARYLRAVLLRNRNHMRRRQRATSRSWSFFECPYIGDNPEHLVLLHAAAEERLHRTGAAIDDGEHAWVGQRLRIDDVFADQGWAHLSGAISAMANNTIRRIKFLAVRDRIIIAAALVDAGGLEVFHGRRFDLPGLQRERHGRIVQRTPEVR